MAFSTRFFTAMVRVSRSTMMAMSRCASSSAAASASTGACSPRSDSRMAMCFAPACTRFSPTAARTTDMADMRCALSIAGASCARCSSIRWVTSSVSRADSLVMRPAKYRTAPGSSAASETVSASSEIAPAGVFSSWETLVTKSRRIRSNRRCSVTSLMNTAYRPSQIWPTRTRR